MNIYIYEFNYVFDQIEKLTCSSRYNSILYLSGERFYLLSRHPLQGKIATKHRMLIREQEPHEETLDIATALVKSVNTAKMVIIRPKTNIAL